MAGTTQVLSAFLVGALIGGLSAIEFAPEGGRATAAGGSTGSAGELFLEEGEFGEGSGEEFDRESFSEGEFDGIAGEPGSSGVTAAAPGSPGSSATGSSGADGGGGTGTTGGSGGGGGSDGDSSGGSQPLACAAGRNGGATDRGVTANAIQMATTTVDTGIGRSFLGDVKFAMEAVRRKTNAGGGVCGRQLQITYRDDGWNAQTGQTYLRNFIQGGIFAVPVGPSSEGLNSAIRSGDFDSSQTPVVGTNGLIIAQYECTDEQANQKLCEQGKAQPWVWPIAVATVQSARIMAADAHARMVRAGVEPTSEDFSIVFDRNFRFGREAALAFNNEVRRLTGANVPGFNTNLNCQENFCGIQAGRSSYSDEVGSRWQNRGKFAALFLEPSTAVTWMNDPNTKAASDRNAFPFGIGGAQTLFTRNFADNCKDRCHEMRVWTGFKPYIEQYLNDAAVQTYVRDLKSVNRNADEFNQFSQAGYVGMLLLVEALEATGPELTRARLKETLDGMRLRSGLTLDASLKFSSSNRYAGKTMQAWTIKHRGSFNGWEAGPRVEDPRPTAGIG